MELTTLSLTSGQIRDIMKLLIEEVNTYDDSGDVNLADYYWNMREQFGKINEKLSERPGEKREAMLILADC